MNIGDNIKVLPPFDKAYPDTYPIELIDETGVCTICGDRQFDPVYLEKV